MESLLGSNGYSSDGARIHLVQPAKLNASLRHRTGNEQFGESPETPSFASSLYQLFTVPPKRDSVRTESKLDDADETSRSRLASGNVGLETPVMPSFPSNTVDVLPVGNQSGETYQFYVSGINRVFRGSIFQRDLAGTVGVGVDTGAPIAASNELFSGGELLEASHYPAGGTQVSWGTGDSARNGELLEAIADMNSVSSAEEGTELLRLLGISDQANLVSPMDSASAFHAKLWDLPSSSSPLNPKPELISSLDAEVISSSSLEANNSTIPSLYLEAKSTIDSEGKWNTSTGSYSTSDSSENNQRSHVQRVVQRVFQAFETLEEGGSFSVRLHPQELGALHLTMKTENAGLFAYVEVENVIAKDALMANLDMLRDRLHKSGIEVRQFEVHVGVQDNCPRSFSDSKNNGGQNKNTGLETRYIRQRANHLELFGVPQEEANPVLLSMLFRSGNNIDLTV